MLTMPAGASCRRATVDRHVVAQANVDIITGPGADPRGLFFLAGKFFKRFDRETCTFVSNVKESTRTTRQHAHHLVGGFPLDVVCLSRAG